MAIESIIELKIEGIEQLDDLEKRLAALRGGPLNFGGSMGFTADGQVTHTHIHQSQHDVHSFSRGIQAAAQGLGNLTMGFVKLSKAILGTGGLISGVTSMATIAGMLKTAQNINQAAFMTNAIGVNPNDLARLKATYGQVFNVESVYSQVARERAAPYSMLMTQMGLSQQQAQMMSPEDLLMRTHQHMRRMAQQYGANELALKAGGLEGIADVDTLMRELNLSPEQLREIEQSRAGYLGATQLQRPEDWQRFNRMMSLGTQNVGTTIQNMVRPLLDPLFNVFNDFFNRVFGHGNQEMWDKAIEYVRNGLERLSEFIKTGTIADLEEKLKTGFMKALDQVSGFLKDQFQPSVDQFTSALRELSDTIKPIANSFRAFGYAIEGISRILGGKGSPLEEWKEKTGFGFRQWKKQIDEAAAPTTMDKMTKSGHVYDAKILEVANRTGLPPHLLYSLTKQESGFNPKAVSPRGAMGMAQFMPKTWEEFGQGSPWDPNAALEAEGSYLLDLHQRLGGGIDEMLAGYNAGPGGVRKAKKKAQKYGADDWTQYLPPETRNYIKSIRQGMIESRKYYSSNTGNTSATSYGNTKVDITVNTPTTADTTTQTSKTPGATNTMSR